VHEVEMLLKAKHNNSMLCSWADRNSTYFML